MNDIIILKLERIAKAFEKCADALDLLANRIEPREKEVYVEADEAKTAREKQEAHFAKKILVEICPFKDGQIVKQGTTNGGKEYAQINIKTEKYGYCNCFVKRDKVEKNNRDWARTLAELNQNGIKFICDLYFTYTPATESFKGRWTASFLRFSSDDAYVKPLMPTATETQVQAQAQAQAQADAENGDAEDIPF